MKEIKFKHLLAFFFVLVFLDILYFWSKLDKPNSSTYHSDGLAAPNAMFLVLLFRKVSEKFSYLIFYILSISSMVLAIILLKKELLEYRIFSAFYNTLIFAFFIFVLLFMYSDVKIYYNKKK